ncbi:MAG: hypothetical protein DRI87_08890 [Bacteroidetes bacterium]|nr:MAG: hypothetical protein DRI87_08890 [Bacteroidota bacterium]
MKKLLYILMIAAVLVSCKKNSTDTPSPVQKQEVEFNINTILPDAGRDYTIPLCDDQLSPDYAMIMLAEDIDGNGYPDTLYADVYYIGTQLYTKALLMPLGTYHVIGFLVMDDLTGDGPSDDDLIYKATPLPASEFEEFVVNGLNIEFVVEQFMKTKILIDVLCFVPDYYDLFGFFWFEITEITVREMCFFGDFCLKHPDDYIGSLYEQGGLFVDEVAIFEILAMHKVGDGQWEYMNNETPYSNLNPDGTIMDGPLCIRYADYDHETDYYKFELKVLVRTGPGTFTYESLWTWEWEDDFETYVTEGVEGYDIGTDGVAEFVVGNCNYDPTDFQLPPWMYLPTQITMEIHSLGYPETGPFAGFYWKWRMTYAEPFNGDYYDIPYNTYVGAWCGDHNSTINGGTHALTQVFCTLDDPADIPPTGINFDQDKLDQLNYLFNNTRQNGNIDIMLPLDALKGENVQKAIWGVLHATSNSMPWGWTSNPGTSNPFFPAYNMSYMALQHGLGYTVLPGGFIGIGFISPNNLGDNDFAQLILILVDP